MPEVLMGSGQLNEGIAKVQLESFKMDVSSYREQIETVIEEKIIRPFLKANNLDEVPEFQWELKSDEEKGERLRILTEEMKNINISPMLKAALEREYALVLGLDELIDMLPTPEEAQKKADEEQEREMKNQEREQEAKIKQPEVPGAKPRANQSLLKKSDENLNKKNVIKQCEHNHVQEASSEMTVKEFVNLQEIAGFNYSDFLIKILQALRTDDFTTLKAISEMDIENGLLPTKEIEKLRLVLKDGFRKNKTINDIEKDIEENVEIKDRKIDGKVTIAAQFRYNSIARTETVRLANEGLVSLYKEHNVKRVRFLAALSERTCSTCEGLNGEVYNINELSVGFSQPPIHTNCRCSMVAVVE